MYTSYVDPKKLKLTAPQTYPTQDVAPPVLGVPLQNLFASITTGTPGPINVQCLAANQWALTYDDGPSLNTAAALDALNAQGVKGTFFVVGSRVIQNPDILRRIYNEGHQIGLQ
jgi:peptidoglycan/xylan/chitin deacetylase (PgdA/CDA1 family)